MAIQTRSSNSTAETAAPPDNPIHLRIWTRVLGIAYFLLGLLMVYVIVQVWPETTEKKHLDAPFYLFGKKIALHSGQRVMAIIMLVGVSGSLVHLVNSFVNYAGSRKLALSWKWYYIFRPFLGAFLALGFYLVVRGGLVSVDNGSESALNLYGLCAVAFLAGMNTDTAIRKLVEVFSNLFQTKPDDRPNKLEENEKAEGDDGEGGEGVVGGGVNDGSDDPSKPDPSQAAAESDVPASTPARKKTARKPSIKKKR